MCDSTLQQVKFNPVFYFKLSSVKVVFVINFYLLKITNFKINSRCYLKQGLPPPCRHFYMIAHRRVHSYSDIVLYSFSTLI